jgi:hypothetical protein
MSTVDKPGSAWWRPLFNGIDKRITPPANSLVRSNGFADAVARFTRLEARLRRQIEAQSTRLLHQVNLPTATDVRRLRAQLSTLEARLRDLDERQEDYLLELTKAQGKATRDRARTPVD